MTAATIAGLVSSGAAASVWRSTTLFEGSRPGVLRLQGPASVRRVFGPPDAAGRRGRFSGLCAATWRAVGLEVWFFSPDLARDPCATGRSVAAVVRGRTWRTGRGLRIGDPAARLRRLYPGASLRSGQFFGGPRSGHDEGWWLRTRVYPCGRFPPLLAKVADRRVRAFVVNAGGCGDD